MNLICLILAAVCFLIGALRGFATPRTPPTMVSRVEWACAGFFFVTLAAILGGHALTFFR